MLRDLEPAADPVVALYAQQGLVGRLLGATAPSLAAQSLQLQLRQADIDLTRRILGTRARTLTGVRLKVIDMLEGADRASSPPVNWTEWLESIQQDLAEISAQCGTDCRAAAEAAVAAAAAAE